MSMIVNYDYDYDNSENISFRVYVVNEKEFKEKGNLARGKWIDFPTDRKTFRQALLEIGVTSADNTWLAHSFNCDRPIDYFLSRQDRVDELNYLASMLNDLPDFEYDSFLAIVEAGYCSNLRDMISLAQGTNIYDKFSFYPDIFNDRDLGWYQVHESGIYSVDLSDGILANFIDYEGLGNWMRLEEGGEFTEVGYIVCLAPVKDVFLGDVPAEYIVTPSIPILEQLANEIAEFIKDFDPYDAEDYSITEIEGFINDIKNGNTEQIEGVRRFLREVIEDDRHMVNEANKLLDEINLTWPETNMNLKEEKKTEPKVKVTNKPKTPKL